MFVSFLTPLVGALRPGWYASSSPGTHEAQRVINPSVRRREPSRGFAHADATARDQDRDLDLAAGLAQCGVRLGLTDAGDHRDDAARAVAQFRIVGLQIDH